jgi:tetratricopeptide (TPR) repeat protein
MALGWLLQGAADLIGPMQGWLDRMTGAVLAAAGVGAALLVVMALLRRRRRAAQVRSAAVRSAAEALKDQLRQRLSEPAGLFAATAPAPTVGACEAFEDDIEAAARTVLLEAGGHRAKARQLLRSRMKGRAGGLNGSEVAYWRQLGVLSLLDGSDDALAAYSRAADLAPENAEAQMLAGVLHLRAGNLDAAETAFRRQIALGQAGNGAGGVVRYRGHTMLGDVLAAREEHDQAVAAYAEAQREVKALLEAEPTSAGLRRDLSVTCDRIGDIHLAKGDLDAALACYRQSLEIAEEQAGREPERWVWQHDLSVSHDRIGDVLHRQGDLDGALEHLRKGLAIAKALAARDPDNAQWQWDLSASYDRIGDALISGGKLKDALANYRESLAVAEALAKRDPANAGWQRDLAVSYHKIGSLEAISDPSEARELLEKGRAIIDRLARIAAYQAQWRSDLSHFDAVLKTLDG